MSVNFSKNQDEITKAWRKVVDASDVPNWALFGYEGSTNNIKLMASGSGGLRELVEELNCSLIQYAFCRVIDLSVGLNKLVLINWQGESAPLSRKGLCASHVGDVSNYFKGCAQTITIRNDDEATEEHLMEQIMKTTTSRVTLSRQQKTLKDSQQQNEDSHTSVINSNSSIKTTDITPDIATDRKSFWQRQEEEEKERLAEEKRRAAQKQAQFERERKQREEAEARKLAETIEKRDRLIDETRKAEKRVASNGAAQPNSLASSLDKRDDDQDDEGRVGRRSELIRLERNQETQSLISKGLIKNKRAIFEQQAANSMERQQPSLARRSSGAIVTQRLNAFKSLDVSGASTSNEATPSPSSSASINKLANGLAKRMSINDDEIRSEKGHDVKTPIKREVETVKLVRHEDISPISQNGGIVSASTDAKSDLDASKSEDVSPKVSNSEPVDRHSMNVSVPDESQVSQDVNGNSKHETPSKLDQGDQVKEEELIKGDVLPTQSNGKLCEALTLFDYEAADNTEISFDPYDKIGYIQKVDPGWWHGKLLTGRFKGQIGLFPSNYVREL